jgi:hypothetical protein
LVKAGVVTAGRPFTTTWSILLAGACIGAVGLAPNAVREHENRFSNDSRFYLEQVERLAGRSTVDARRDALVRVSGHPSFVPRFQRLARDPTFNRRYRHFYRGRIAYPLLALPFFPFMGENSLVFVSYLGAIAAVAVLVLLATRWSGSVLAGASAAAVFLAFGASRQWLTTATPDAVLLAVVIALALFVDRPRAFAAVTLAGALIRPSTLVFALPVAVASSARRRHGWTYAVVAGFAVLTVAGVFPSATDNYRAMQSYIAPHHASVRRWLTQQFGAFHTWEDLVRLFVPPLLIVVVLGVVGAARTRRLLLVAAFAVATVGTIVLAPALTALRFELPLIALLCALAAVDVSGRVRSARTAPPRRVPPAA